jgi:hypothetical protein
MASLLTEMIVEVGEANSTVVIKGKLSFSDLPS